MPLNAATFKEYHQIWTPSQYLFLVNFRRSGDLTHSYTPKLLERRVNNLYLAAQCGLFHFIVMIGEWRRRTGSWIASAYLKRLLLPPASSPFSSKPKKNVPTYRIAIWLLLLTWWFGNCSNKDVKQLFTWILKLFISYWYFFLICLFIALR